MTFPSLSAAMRRDRLQPPTGPVTMVLDTDTYNEVDDQFALVHALLSPEKLSVEAIYAAPFHNARSDGPGDGMERSYAEILRLLERLGRSPEGWVFRGSRDYLADEQSPRESAAVTDLVQRALAARADEPLYVVAIGAITNVASALLLEPRIVERIVVVWLGGHGLHWPHTREFNLKQDPAAARVVFDSGVPLVHVGCQGVASHLLTTLPELERFVAGRGAIGDYLVETVRGYHDDHFAWSKVLWDLAPIGWLLDADWVPSELTSSPIVTPEVTWQRDDGRHSIRSARFVHRDRIYADLFRKLEQATGS